MKPKTLWSAGSKFRCHKRGQHDDPPEAKDHAGDRGEHLNKAGRRPPGRCGGPRHAQVERRSRSPTENARARTSGISELNRKCRTRRPRSEKRSRRYFGCQPRVPQETQPEARDRRGTAHLIGDQTPQRPKAPEPTADRRGQSKSRTAAGSPIQPPERTPRRVRVISCKFRSERGGTTVAATPRERKEQNSRSVAPSNSSCTDFQILEYTCNITS